MPPFSLPQHELGIPWSHKTASLSNLSTSGIVPPAIGFAGWSSLPSDTARLI